MARYKFAILQTLLIAAIFALWLRGSLDSAFAGDSRYFVSAVLAIGAVGLILAAIGRVIAAEEVRDILPIIAVIGMQVGILSALAVTAQALLASGDPSKAVGGFFSALSIALHVSVAALSCYLWLRVTIWLTGSENA